MSTQGNQIQAPRGEQIQAPKYEVPGVVLVIRRAPLQPFGSMELLPPRPPGLPPLPAHPPALARLPFPPGLWLTYLAFVSSGPLVYLGLSRPFRAAARLSRLRLGGRRVLPRSVCADAFSTLARDPASPKRFFWLHALRGFLHRWREYARWRRDGRQANAQRRLAGGS